MKNTSDENELLKIGKLENWFRERARELWVEVQCFWWMIFLLTLSLSLFLVRFYGLEMLWIFGGSMIFISIVVLGGYHALVLWCEGREASRRRYKTKHDRT